MRKSHIVFGILCMVFTLWMLAVPIIDQEYFMKIIDGYGMDILPYIIIFWLGIFMVCYITYLIIDRLRHKQKSPKIQPA